MNVALILHHLLNCLYGILPVLHFEPERCLWPLSPRSHVEASWTRAPGRDSRLPRVAEKTTAGASPASCSWPWRREEGALPHDHDAASNEHKQRWLQPGLTIFYMSLHKIQVIIDEGKCFACRRVPYLSTRPLAHFRSQLMLSHLGRSLK